MVQNKGGGWIIWEILQINYEEISKKSPVTLIAGWLKTRGKGKAGGVKAANSADVTKVYPPVTGSDQN